MLSGKIIGYDISNAACLISCYNEELNEPEMYEASPENNKIPLVIGKKNEIWGIGVEAKRISILHEGKLANDLMNKSILGQQIVLGEETYDAVWLLSKFVQMSLEKFEKIDTISFTVPNMNEDIAQLLRGVAVRIGIEKHKIFIHDYRESFCNYMFYQPRELWQYDSAMFYCDKDEVRAYMLKRIQTSAYHQKEVFVSVDDVANAKKEEMDVIYPLIHGEKARRADSRFKMFIESVFEQRMVSSVYLTGEGFENNWYPESLKVLCNGRKAFLGSELYSIGACYLAYRKITKVRDELIYIDEHKLTEQISIEVRKDGELLLYPIVPWGNHWYEYDEKVEILLEDTEDIELHVDSLYKGKVQIHRISLDELPERESYSMRLRIHAIFTGPDTCKVTVKDVGFGEFYQASKFEEEVIIDLGGNHGQHYSLS